MPVCAHCGSVWKYKEAVKHAFRTKMICPSCYADNYHTLSGCGKAAIFPLSMILYNYLIYMSPDTSLPRMMAGTAGIGAAAFFLLPFTVELTKKQGHIW
ncbi:TIGR04104 family putative zinc finger protein [Virgibacillus xinjiangensis]|uniref:TIGR04104 family putative zinc finger protein n=1 Tax=Virgibacillus xinjiangensis TaxID=393090 RepID=A0ABV7CXL7_9BACI